MAKTDESAAETTAIHLDNCLKTPSGAIELRRGYSDHRSPLSELLKNDDGAPANALGRKSTFRRLFSVSRG
jgi:hypothetical protein